MTGHRKFSELEAAMSPARRARVNRAARKLGDQIDREHRHAKGDVSYKRLHELSCEFTQLWNKLHALYLDAIVGFASVRSHVEARQAQLIKLLAGTEIATEEFQDTNSFTYSGIFSDDFWTAGIHQFTEAAGVHPTQGEVKARNSPNGQNFIVLGQVCLVSFYDFWNDYLRREYVIAKGILDPKEQNSEIIKESLREYASHDLWGDISYLRHSIVHKRGIASSDVAKCKLIKWFKPGDPIAITPQHMRAIFLALLKYRNDLFMEHFPPRINRIPEYYSG